MGKLFGEEATCLLWACRAPSTVGPGSVRETTGGKKLSILKLVLDNAKADPLPPVLLHGFLPGLPVAFSSWMQGVT